MTEEASGGEVAAVVEAPKWAAETEQEAKALGWKSPDEWKGEIPSGYIDNPEKYLERAESFTPFRKLKDRLTETERKQEERFKRLEAMTDKTVERLRSELQAAKMEAVETGDVEKFKALEAQQAELPKSVPQAEGVPADHKSAIDRWAVGKDWFRQDAIMTQASVVAYGEAQQKGLSDPTAILAYVDKRMAESFPHKFAKETPVQQQAVDPGLTFGGSTTADGFTKLPKDAQANFKRFVEKGWIASDTKETRAQFVKDYNDAA